MTLQCVQLLKLVLLMKLNVMWTMKMTMITDISVGKKGTHEKPANDLLNFGVGQPRRSLSNSAVQLCQRRCGWRALRRPRRFVAEACPGRHRLWRLVAKPGQQRRAGRPTGGGPSTGHRLCRCDDGFGQLLTARCLQGGLHEHLLPLLLRQQRPLLLDDEPIELVELPLVVVVDEVTARSVRAQPGRVVGFAQIGLVLRVACDRAQLGPPVRELALVAVLARAVFLVRPTQLRLVAAQRRSRLGSGQRRRQRILAGAAIHPTSLPLAPWTDVGRRGRRRALDRRREEQPGEVAAELVCVAGGQRQRRCHR